MDAPHWKTSISQALSQSSGTANRVLQLSSLDASDPSRPFIRSLFFHSFVSAAAHPSRTVLVAPVDMRTPKLAHLLAHPSVRLSWQLPDAGEQCLMSGTVAILPTPEDTLYPHYAFAIRRPEPNSGLQALADEAFDWDKLREDVYQSLDLRHQQSFKSRRPAGSSPCGDDTSNPNGVPEAEEHVADVEILEMKEWPTTRRTRFWRSREGIWASEQVV
ncbi:hypothetical protein HDZ31DRAFT_48594 [Schizophyllum fasciatum]